ncbi:thiol-disulfide oxidoreductase DCC family protein [Neptuniibacter caesariensis]|uniref:Thiol-disulfide oxidoreductase n=1 Tax=Neptuniibacter caesariensis TaxID=207954 RepID=A0A7U8C6C1_NEPCE|nr:DUF393 domain-containing protein [Neptuniibacter caesariensis]EAR60711.1 hypothetical protein MED92_13588 [Neptuniibacter caesariensis]
MRLKSKPILFYDGSCSLCRHEINFYQKLDKKTRIIWSDISVEEGLLSEHNISYLSAMEELHGINQKGEILKGVDAFILIWQELPYFRTLAKLVVACRVLPLLRFAYKRFARWRFQKQQCSITAKRKPITTDDQ